MHYRALEEKAKSVYHMTYYKRLPTVFVSMFEECQGGVWGVLTVFKGFWTGLGNRDVQKNPFGKSLY